MKNKIYNNKIFYGWYIVAAAAVLMGVCWGIVFNTSSLFINPISNDLGISRQSMNITFSIRSVTQLTISLLSGIIFTRLKLKNLMKIASITSVISLYLYSYVKSTGSLYTLTAISGISTVLLGTMPLSMIINNWFYKKNGTALGIAFMGSGIGGMIFNTLAGKWILIYGWRTTYQILALIVLLTAVPLVFFVLKINPKEVGLSPLGFDNGSSVREDSFREDEMDGVMFSQVRKTIRFWMLCIAISIFAMSGMTILNNTAPHLIDINYSSDFSANIVALVMGSLALGKIVLGYLFDRFGIRISTLISSVAIVFSFISLLNADKYIALVMLIICSGLGVSFLQVAYPIITLTLFGKKDYSTIYGILNVAHGIGGIISPLVVGYLFDISGSYNSSFILMMIFAMFAVAIYLSIFPKKAETIQSSFK